MSRELQTKTSLRGVLTLILSVLLLITSLFALRLHSSIDAYSQYQKDLAQKQAAVSANTVDVFTRSLRETMIAIALDNFFFLDVDRFKTSEALQEQMHTRLKYYFPQMYSFSLVDTAGEVVGGDIDFSMGDTCRLDARHVASRLRFKTSSDPFISAIHPVPGAYHFDVMFPVFLQGRSLVFFMSFHATDLHKILLENRVSEHPVYLVSERFPNLIEVSYEGVRDNIDRPIHLTEQELSQIQASQKIENTQWTVLVKANMTLVDSFKKQQYFDTALLYGGFLVIWFLVAWLLLHQELKRKDWLEKLDFLSHHDALTGACNRRKLEKVLANVLESYRNLGNFSGILYIDLNDFKPINDQYGHRAGDDVLKVFVKRLNACCRDGDIVARIGGDEFVVVINNLGLNERVALGHLTEASYRCYETLRRPITVTGETEEQHVIEVSASIGTLLINKQYASTEDIMHEADDLMYRAKQNRKD